MTGDRTPTGDLRERITDALYRRLREQVGSDAGAQIRAEAKADDLIDAVLPVVEAETAALRQRGEEAEDRLRKATDAYTRLHAEVTGDRWQKRAEEAEAAVQRVRDLAENEEERVARGFGYQFGGKPFPASVRAADVLAALDQSKETP